MDNSPQWNILTALTKGNKLPQALLFTGPKGLGQKETAFRFIQILHEGPIQPVDFVEIVPENKEIQIDQIRHLREALFLKPQFAKVKAVLINPAHALNQPSQNCLLKTLEEPPGPTLFILISHLPDLLLPTVRSRCQTIRFYPQTEPAFFDNKIRGFSSLLTGSLVEKFNFAKKFVEENKENLTESSLQFLDGLICYLRAVLLGVLGISPQRSPQRPDLCIDYSLKEIKTILEAVDKTKLLISSTNTNQRLALENLFLQI